jgi:ethanolamine utilization protein EutQ
MAGAEQVERFAPADVPVWYRAKGVQMAIGDVVDATNGDSMSVGFARYAKGARNDWSLTYDEALVITKGTFSVESELGSRTASAGEVIFLRAGARITYRADEEAELVYVSHPHWLQATEASEHAGQLADFEEIVEAQAVE